MSAANKRQLVEPGACDEPATREKPSITTVILTFNEELHILRAIESAKQFSDEILVVDSFSTDDTVRIATSAGARVISNKFVSHAAQFQHALDHGSIKGSWTMRLDADEIIGADLAARINSELKYLPADVAGIVFSRRHLFMSRWVRHGGRYPLHLVRLWRTGQGEVEDRWMDEHVVVHGGRTVHMAGEFWDASLHDINFLVAKHNGYATREAIEVLDGKYLFLERRASSSHGVNSRQATFKRVVKEKVYNRLPFGFGPLLYFLYRYIIQLGFLDGRSGLIYHFIQGFFYRFLVDAKTLELELLMRGCRSAEERVAVIATATGLKIEPRH